MQLDTVQHTLTTNELQESGTSTCDVGRTDVIRKQNKLILG